VTGNALQQLRQQGDVGGFAEQNPSAAVQLDDQATCGKRPKIVYADLGIIDFRTLTVVVVAPLHEGAELGGEAGGGEAERNRG
jgi:hypothetical protein